MKKNIKLLISIMIAGLSFAIGYFVNFFLTRFITDNVGTDAQGYVTLCKTFATYVVVATTALNSYAARFITLEYHKGNIEKAKIYYNSVFGANLVVGGLFFLLSIILTPFIGSILSVPSSLKNDVTILFVLVFFNLFISLISTAFQAATYIKDKVYLSSIFRCVSYVMEAVSLLCLYNLFSPKVLYTGIGLIVATLVTSYGYFFITKKFTPDLTIDLKKIDLKSIKELVVAGVWNSVNGLGNTLNSGLDMLVSNAVLSAVAMGQVSIVKSIVNIFSGLYQMVAQPFQPRFLHSYAEKDNNRLLHDLKLSMRISGLISNLAFSGVVAFGLSYFKLWLPNQDTNLLYRLTVIAVATSVLEGAMYPLYYIYTLTIKNKIPCIITIIGGLANVLGMVLLIKYTSLGIYAVFITTAIIMNVINGITNPIYMSKCLGLSFSTFYPSILRHVVSCLVMTVVIKKIGDIINPSSWIELIFGAIIATILGGFIHVLIAFNFTEIKSYVGKAVRMLKK